MIQRCASKYIARRCTSFPTGVQFCCLRSYWSSRGLQHSPYLILPNASLLHALAEVGHTLRVRGLSSCTTFTRFGLIYHVRATFSFLPFICCRCGGCGQGIDGATTVASTSYLASLAGVKVFVTGGMGGVHRGAETTFDVSADLMELAQTPIVVVCAGIKSILDVEKTLEVGIVSCVARYPFEERVFFCHTTGQILSREDFKFEDV